jgi:hypothetical protein
MCTCTSTSDEVDKIIKNQRGISQLNAHEGSAPLMSVDSAISFVKVERLFVPHGDSHRSLRRARAQAAADLIPEDCHRAGTAGG